MEGDWVTVDGDRIVLVATKQEYLAGVTELYRCFDYDNKLLYVGISMSSLVRMAAHSDESSWFCAVSRIEIERFPSRRMAAEMERRAIREERPMFNVRHNRRKSPAARQGGTVHSLKIKPGV